MIDHNPPTDDSNTTMSIPLDMKNIKIRSYRRIDSNVGYREKLKRWMTQSEENEEILPDVESEFTDIPDSSLPTTADDESIDPDKQGTIRAVKGAHLIYKRKHIDGYFEELWFFNVGKSARRDALQVKREILAGTDIEDAQMSSQDGSQSYDLWTSGNGQILHIIGLPN